MLLQSMLAKFLRNQMFNHLTSTVQHIMKDKVLDPQADINFHMNKMGQPCYEQK